MTEEKKPKKIFTSLIKEINDPGLCLNCGACISSCPTDALALDNGRITPTGNPCLGVDCGICYDNCPQVVPDEKVAEQVFGKKPESDNIGFYEKAYSVQTKLPDVRIKAQDGGAVTTILTSLLATGFIDGAVVMGVSDDDPWRPEPKVVTTRGELLECAGSKYSPAPILVGLREAVDCYSLDELALVGTPCQVKAFRWMDSGEAPVLHVTSSVKLVVGIFCFEAFPYEGFFKKVIEDQLDFDLSEISKFDIKENKFMIYREGKPKKELKLKDLTKFSFLPCGFCSDFTAELADISIGDTGSPLGYSTVLLRNQLGTQAFDQVLRSGALEARVWDDDGTGMKELRRLASVKKRKTEKKIQKRRKTGKSLPPRLQEPSD